jgi:hypothetical protein
VDLLGAIAGVEVHLQFSSDPQVLLVSVHRFDPTNLENHLE